jgi:hypothetical protein
VRVGKLVIEQAAIRAAADIDRFYRRTSPTPAEAGVPLALSFDAKGIVMLPKDLREDTRRNAEAKQAAGGPAMKTRLAAEEKLAANAWLCSARSSTPRQRHAPPTTSSPTPTPGPTSRPATSINAASQPDGPDLNPR